MNTQTMIQRKKITFILLACLSFLLTGCFLKQDRTTVVYGTITNEKGQPVDSILVIFQGMQNLSLEILSRKYSEVSGEYEIAVDVPRKYKSVNVTVPFFYDGNPKYVSLFKGKKSIKNGIATVNCCTAQIGDKTKYDFQLIPK